MLRRTIQYIWFLCVCLSLTASAEEVVPAPLPDPLSLDQAMQMIDEGHPALLQARLGEQYAETDLLAANASSSIRVDLDGRLRWTEPQLDVPLTKDSEDHRLGLVVSKPVYDGGYAEANRQAAQLTGTSAGLDYDYARKRYAITVMQQFFNIILADLEVARDTEEMSTVFVRMDRGQDNHDLGRISDVQLLELQSAYQESRVRMYNSEAKARQTRQALALSLNRPGQQPSQLTPPDIDVSGRILPEYEELLSRILSGNSRLVALDRSIEAARVRITAARSGSKPKVTALIERAEQSRDTATSDKWRVGVEWSMPIYDGGMIDSAVRRAHLDVNKLMYQRQQLELELRAQVREMVEQFRILNAEYDSNLAFTDYRELYMDRSRALYELEVKTDLGDSMVQISESQLRSARQQFEMALLLAQLNLLAGEPIMKWDALSKAKPETEGGSS